MTATWDQQGGFESHNTSFGTGASQRTEERTKIRSIFPLTVEGILKLEMDNDLNAFIFENGREVDQVTLVGKICEGQDEASRYMYKLDDLTSSTKLMLRQFYDRDGDVVSVAMIPDGKYVRVYGHIRQFQEQTMINVLSIREITNEDEITRHRTQVEWAYLTMQQSDANQAGGDAGGEEDAEGMTAPQRRVQKVIASWPDADTDITPEDIQRAIPTMNQATINDILTALSNEGHIYTTIDDQHYKTI